MTFEELMNSTPPMQQHALVKGYQVGFAAGAASRHPEIAELVAALEDTLYFLEQHSNRWDSVKGKHPNDVATAARAALAKVRKP